MLKRLLPLCLTLVLAACAGTSSVKPEPVNAGLSSNPHTALRQLRARLANADSLQQVDIRLLMAELELQQGDTAAARQSLSQLAAADPRHFSLEQRVSLMCLKASYLTTKGQARKAVKALPKNQANFSPDLQRRVLRTQANTLGAAGYTVEASRAQVQLQALLTQPEARASNAKGILSRLSALPADSLQQLADKHISPAMDSWVGFVRLTKPQLFSLHGFNQAVAQWRQQYRLAVVPESVIVAIRSNIQSKTSYPGRIALLLPLSGKYTQQAESIRDGFMAAYYAYSDTDKPEIIVIDSTAQPTAGTRPDAASALPPIARQLQQAHQQGAGLVVGPLLKSSIQTVAALPELPLPVLALNYLDKDNSESLHSGFYQFGLLPEDEAEQAAQFAILRNQHKAALMVPQNKLGQRMASAFEQAYTALGGQVLSVQEYAPKANDFSRSIKSMLNIQQSLSRKSVLSTVLRSQLAFEPRTREDIELIYLVASPNQARSIKPQLKFHGAGEIPVLGSSKLFNGNANPGLNRDINDIVFTQSPWVLNAAEIPLHQQLQALWPARMAHGGTLFALGADAFHLIPYLSRMRQDPQLYRDGYTGTLRADNEGRLHRQLLWAKFADGQVQLEDSAILDAQGDADSPASEPVIRPVSSAP